MLLLFWIVRKKTKQSSIVETLVKSVKKGTASVCSRSGAAEPKLMLSEEPQKKTEVLASEKSTALTAAALPVAGSAQGGKSSRPAITARPTPVQAVPRPNAKFMFYAPGAKRVFVSGEFNAWSPEATPLARQGNGLWETGLVLKPGQYQYKFVADGQWLLDPNASETLPNGFGSVNSVIQVQA